MSILKRISDPRTIYFITNVTYERKPILREHSDLLRKSIHNIQDRFDIDLHAWVILPDHFHLIIDAKGHDISNLMQRIKMSFIALYHKHLGLKSGRVWQHRFWDHIIRDQEDWNRHVDYIHYNPVKHGFAQSPFEWKYSSIHKFHKDGMYGGDWGEKSILFDCDFGE